MVPSTGKLRGSSQDYNIIIDVLTGWSREGDEAMTELFGPLEEERFFSGCREQSSRTP